MPGSTGYTFVEEPLSSGIGSKMNLTAVTVNAAVTTDQQLQEISVPAGYFNSTNQAFWLHGSGIYSIGAAQTPTLTFKAKLCTVSGCGSGTVVTLASITTGNTLQLSSNNWNLELLAATNTTGQTGNFLVHGSPGLALDLAASATGADTIYGDGNTTNSGSIDLTAALFLDFTVATSTGSTTNAVTQQIAAIMPQSNPAGSTPVGGSASWSSLTNPSVNLGLTMAANTSTFTYNAATGSGTNLFVLTDTASNTGTGALLATTIASGSAAIPHLIQTNPSTSQTATVISGLSLQAATAADSSHNYYSPSTVFNARYWTGSVDANDTYTLSNQCGNTGTNPACYLNIVHAGTTGFSGLQVGNLAVNTTPSANPLRVSGTGVGNSVVSLGATNASPTSNIFVVQNSSATNKFFIDKNFQVASGQDGSGSNGAGGNATWRSGIPTGNAAQTNNCLSGTVKAASGSTAQTQVNRSCTNLQTTLSTNNTAQTLMTAAVASNTAAGGIIDYCVHMTDATDHQMSCGTTSYSIVNKAGTITNGTMATTNTSSALSTGTLTVSFALSGSSTPVSVQVTANSSLTPTSMLAMWHVRNSSDANDITITNN